jgi:halocyanin-like protein
MCMNRREFLRTAGGAAGATTAATAATGSAAAQEGGGNSSSSSSGGGSASGPIDYKGWLEGAKGWGGAGSTVDKRGKKKVTIKVGVGSSGYQFKPAGVHIDPGTKVTWKWVGSGTHNVETKKGAPADFKSELKSSGTFTKTIKKKGIIPYFCNPHRSSGMKGALAVGDGVPHKSVAAAQQADPHEMGVPLQAHYVGAATVLMMISSLVFTFYTLKYGESAHTKGGNN